MLVNDNNKSEIQEYLEKNINQQKDKKVIAGFKVLLERIADSGYNMLPPKLFKCWKEKENDFCEIRKAKHRISCFKYSNDKFKLLFGNTFC